MDAEIGRPAVVAFGGMRGGLIIPPFEFFAVSERVTRCTRVFLRDPHQCWYQRGIPELGQTFDGAAQQLGRLLATAQPARTVFVGTSAGAYAALGMGILLDADEVHAFGAQTTLIDVDRKAIGDDRWSERLEGLPPIDSAILDLRQMLAERRSRPGLHLYVAEDDPLDVAHAERVVTHPAVQVHRYPRGGHTLVRDLRDSGELEQLLARALNP